VADLLAQLRQAYTDLCALDGRCALVGGFAYGLHVEPRMTKDLDFAIGVNDDKEAEDLMRVLHRRGYQIAQLLEHAELGRLSTLRLRLPQSTAATADVDLLFASCGIEPEIVNDAIEFVIAGAGTIRVARIGHLIAMKLLSESDERPNDRSDLHGLARAATKSELDAARHAVHLIESRAFHRGRDLPTALERLIAATRASRA
jgi:predicted nucleotidyltransferase